LIRYLPEFGWSVTVLTARLPGADPTIVQSEYVNLPGALKRAVGLGAASAHETLGIAPAARGTRRTFRQAAVAWGYRLTSYPDAQVGWFIPGRNAVRAALGVERFDAILSSSPPFTTDLMIASVAPQIPWVADYRDLWADSDAYASRVRRRFDRWLERWTLARVCAATTISEPMADVMRSHRPGLPVDVIPNGFDAAEWQDIPFETEDRTTFLYAGQLFGGRRDPRPLFRVLRQLIDAGDVSGDEVRVDVYSALEPWLQEAIAEARLDDVVRVRGVVPRDEVLRAERRADRLLVLLWEGANAEGIVTGKLFEYFGAGRRILAIGGPSRSAVDDLLRETGTGTRAMTDTELRREVLEAITEHRRGAVARTQGERVEAFSASEMARRFAGVLDRVSAV
jgi:glycosyltransferase involved in cell wall biosynthesis